MEIIFSTYNHLIHKDNVRLVYNALSNSLLEVDEDLFSILKTQVPGQKINNAVLLENEQLLEFYVLTTKEDENSELNGLRLNNLMHRFDKTFMSLTICPTSYCNFECTYCFEENRPNVFMSDDTEGKLLKFVEQYNSLKTLSVMWFGGEPLLNFNKIVSLTDKFLEKDYVFSAGIITNGYLLNGNVIKQLDQLRINYVQITIDGLEETHNLRRPYKGKGNSFKIIIKNIDSFCAIRPEAILNIRVNIDKTNENEFGQLYKFIRERYPVDKVVITPAYVSDHNNGCKNPCLFDRKEKAKFRLKHEDISYLYPNSQGLDCMSRQINSFLINADGGLYKCYNDVGNKLKEIGNLHSKGINADLLTTYLMDADFHDDLMCRKCNIYPICSGGCPYVRIKNKNDLSLKGETCEEIKDFEEDFILSHVNKRLNSRNGNN